jgi:DMSO/TMAO reductase YedYZ molybdopterin-dependent catalytic subunit
MSRISRRALITAGISTVVGGTGLAAAVRIARRYGLIPPGTTGPVLGVGETLTYSSQRMLMASGSAAREFDRSQISTKPNGNGDPPTDAAFERLRAGKFASWRLSVDGLVARPMSLSLADLRSYPASSHITELACEEGWSYIAEWTGVSLSHVLSQAGVKPDARYVLYYSHQTDWWESIDLPEAMHPQTLVTYGMNGAELPVPFGAPLRLRVPRQLGYKSVKHITRITVTDDANKNSKGAASAALPPGFSWYAGI